ncbi:hypothetical protein Tco_0017152 [Tanacetum coccineum]
MVTLSEREFPDSDFAKAEPGYVLILTCFGFEFDFNIENVCRVEIIVSNDTLRKIVINFEVGRNYYLDYKAPTVPYTVSRDFGQRWLDIISSVKVPIHLFHLKLKDAIFWH